MVRRFLGTMSNHSVVRRAPDGSDSISWDRVKAMQLAQVNLDTHYAEHIRQLPLNNAEVYVSGLYRPLSSSSTSTSTHIDSNKAHSGVNDRRLWKGKSLHAGKRLSRGDVVFAEKKALGITEKISYNHIQVCEYCMRTLGSLEQQVGAMSVPSKRASIETVNLAYSSRDYTKDINAHPIRRSACTLEVDASSDNGVPTLSLTSQTPEKSTHSTSTSDHLPTMTKAEQQGLLPYGTEAIAYALLRRRHQNSDIEDIPREITSSDDTNTDQSTFTTHCPPTTSTSISGSDILDTPGSDVWPLPDHILEVAPIHCRYGSGEVSTLNVTRFDLSSHVSSLFHQQSYLYDVI